MASPFLSTSRAPHCLMCVRRIQSTLGGPSRQQIRGKKKMPKISTIPVRLLQDISRYGAEGAIIAVQPGRMRNEWFPKGMAEYMTATQIKDLGLKGKVLERDSTFGLLRKRVNTEPVEVSKAQDAVDALAITPERAHELVSGILPLQLVFPRAPVVAAAPQRHSPSIPSLATISDAAADGSQDGTPEPTSKTSIYGSVTTADIVASIKTYLGASVEATRLNLAPEDIAFVEATEEGDRVKHLGEYDILIQVKGVESPVRRKVSVVAQE